MKFEYRMGYDESRCTADRERVRTQASYMHFKNRLLGISANLSRDTGPHTGETLSRQLLCSSSDTFNMTQSLSPSEELSGLRKSASPEGPQDHFRGTPSWVLQTLSQPSGILPQETSRAQRGLDSGQSEDQGPAPGGLCGPCPPALLSSRRNEAEQFLHSALAGIRRPGSPA